jgi:hypothetical protein
MLRRHLRRSGSPDAHGNALAGPPRLNAQTDTASTPTAASLRRPALWPALGVEAVSIWAAGPIWASDRLRRCGAVINPKRHCDVSCRQSGKQSAVAATTSASTCRAPASLSSSTTVRASRKAHSSTQSRSCRSANARSETTIASGPACARAPAARASYARWRQLRRQNSRRRPGPAAIAKPRPHHRQFACFLCPDGSASCRANSVTVTNLPEQLPLALPDAQIPREEPAVINQPA